MRASEAAPRTRLQGLLLAMLGGAEWASAIRRNGKPCRIRLPDDPDSRAALVEAHLRGEPMRLTFHADGHRPWQECGIWGEARRKTLCPR